MRRYLSKEYTFRRKIQVYEELFFRLIMLLASLLIALVLLQIVWSIFREGVGSVSWEMLTNTPKGGFYFGKEGGILNAIIGSLYLGLGATLLAFVTGLPVALFMNTWLAPRKRLVNLVRFTLDLLWGIPSIVYGAFGFALMIALGIKASLLAGIIVLALLILPIMIRAIDEGLKASPPGLTEATYALGATTSELSFSVLTRQCLPHILTAILLSFGRAIGD
ncbi:MAG TPA: ABC transporter permease subunit, partial [Bacteroidales bacterium]|nr:ABC transporter permease subunit [Bacteroidales bacterium]